jgi:presenilin-like A22 family membrane protease
MKPKIKMTKAAMIGAGFGILGLLLQAPIKGWPNVPIVPYLGGGAFAGALVGVLVAIFLNFRRG